MIKRCNDFGAGGVSVAIGELAEGLEVDLNAVPRKYEGLDGTELAISESQERMAVVLAPEDVPAFLAMAAEENLRAVPVAKVQEEKRLRLFWNGKAIVDVSRAFLDSNGAEKHIYIETEAPKPFAKEIKGGFAEEYRALAASLNCCSRRGLAERFDSTIGAGTVLMPFGGKHQQTPIQAMVHKVSVEGKDTDTCSFMSWGYDPYISEKSPYHGAYLAVVESVCKLIASGAAFEEVYLTFQEYFGKPGTDPKRWGKPLSALLGAFKAQTELGVGAIGGKDSMSGSFEQLDVPPTLVSFAVTTDPADAVVSPEFKEAGHLLVRLAPERSADGLPLAESLKDCFAKLTALMRAGKVFACYTPGMGGAAEAVLKMAIGNGLGFRFSDALSVERIFGYDHGAFLLEVAEQPAGTELVGEILAAPQICFGADCLPLAALQQSYEEKLEPVYHCNIAQDAGPMKKPVFRAESRPAPALRSAKPKVLIPVFPGTNCEYDSAKAMLDAGADPQIMVLRNLTAEGVAESVEAFAKALKDAQMIFIPGGFSGGDEPDGSGKFITAFFRNAAIKEEVAALLERRDGLICGICNGFQALIKLGLVPFGRIVDTEADFPTLTFNRIARHQSRIVRTRVASNKSPWLALTEPGEIYSVPISHGEGRLIATPEMLAQMEANGQIATQYVDLDGEPSGDVRFNPNGSVWAIEGITSPDGRVFGKMGHAERKGAGLYKNVPGNYDIRMFEAAVRYFR